MAAGRLLLPALFLPFLALSLPAQDPGMWRVFERRQGPEPPEGFGSAVAGVGDVDADGVPDLAVGSPGAAPGGRNGAGRVHVFSGATGETLLVLDGDTQGGHLGSALAPAGDLNGDGHADILAGAPGLGRSNAGGGVIVFSGADGSELLRWEDTLEEYGIGEAVAGGADLTGDGIPDVVAGGSGDSSLFAFLWHEGKVVVLSGADGSLVRDTHGGPFDNLGRNVGVLGDLDGNGYGDWFYSVPRWDDTSFDEDSGLLVVVLEPSGATLITPPEIGDELYSGQALGDFDGDGRRDIAGQTSFSDLGGFTANGGILIWSALDGTLLHTIPNVPGSWTYTWTGDGGDLNGDGFAELLAVRDESNGPGLDLDVLAGPDGRLLYSFPLGGPDATNLNRVTLAPLGDAAGTGYPQFAVGMPHTSRAGFYSRGLVGIAGFEPFLRPSTDRILASTGGTLRIDLRFPPDAAGEFWQLLLSATGTGPTPVAGLNVPLSQDSLFLRTLAGDYAMLESVQGATGVLDAQGRGRIEVAFSPGTLAPLVGQDYFAAVATGPDPAGNGHYVSAAVRILIEP